jgi:hypothetical protein
MEQFGSVISKSPNGPPSALAGSALDARFDGVNVRAPASDEALSCPASPGVDADDESAAEESPGDESVDDESALPSTCELTAVDEESLPHPVTMTALAPMHPRKHL